MMPLITVGSVSLCVRGALVHNRYWRTLRIALAAWFDRVPIGPKVCALSASVGAKIVKHSLTMKLFFCFQRWTQVFAWASIYCALGCKLKLGCKQLTQAWCNNYINAAGEFWSVVSDLVLIGNRSYNNAAFAYAITLCILQDAQVGFGPCLLVTKGFDGEICYRVCVAANNALLAPRSDLIWRCLPDYGLRNFMAVIGQCWILKPTKLIVLPLAGVIRVFCSVRLRVSRFFRKHCINCLIVACLNGPMGFISKSSAYATQLSFRKFGRFCSALDTLWLCSA